MGYLNEDGLETLVGKIKGQVIELTSAEYRQLPATKNTDNKLYFVTDEAYAYQIDDEPTSGSSGLVKSGGVYNWTSKIGSGTLTTTAQTLIPAVNELNAKIGSTDISTIGDGTVTGAVDALNKGLFTDLSYGLSEYDFPGFAIIRATATATQIPVTGVNLTKAPVSDCFAVVQYYNGSSNVFGTLQVVSSGKLYLLNSSGARVTGSYIEGTLVYPLPH